MYTFTPTSRPGWYLMNRSPARKAAGKCRIEICQKNEIDKSTPVRRSPSPACTRNPSLRNAVIILWGRHHGHPFMAFLCQGVIHGHNQQPCRGSSTLTKPRSCVQEGRGHRLTEPLPSARLLQDVTS
ncbi:uncharacterized protein LOC144376961 [Ictidomys tridecemlineatus]